MRIRRQITVHRSPEDLYAFWRRLENLARIAPGDTEVTQTAPGRSHWVAHGPGHREFTWDTEIVQDDPGRVIAWRSLPGGDVCNTGEVRFEPVSGRHTRIDVEIDYTPPGAFVGKLVGAMVQEHVEAEIEAGLDRVKHELELGQ